MDHARLDEVVRALAPSGGFFFEAGANDGRRQSFTYGLEQNCGWSGILVEPSRQAFQELVENRPNARCVNAALVSGRVPYSTVKGTFAEGALTGSMVPELFARSPDQHTSRFRKLVSRVRTKFHLNPLYTLTDVASTTIEAVLVESEVTEVDLLILDVEGAEVEALRGLNLNRLRPKLMVVEVRSLNAWNFLIWVYKHDYLIVERLSDFGPVTPGGWSGDHDDYLLIDKRNLVQAPHMKTILGV